MNTKIIENLQIKTQQQSQQPQQPKNYIIDGDSDGTIESDFFSQLKNMLNHSETNAEAEVGNNHDHDDNNNCVSSNHHNNKNAINDEDNCCLLTKEPLQDVHIVLSCGHKFNYVPIYREVIAQKTIGLSPNGYYTSHSLKRNEIKCPYCRNIQDKLLPYLEYDGVKKIFNINHPTKLSMTSQPCMYSAACIPSKKSKKNTSCKESAIKCHNGTYVCKKHYELSLATPIEIQVSTLSPSSTISKCGVILRYGKNKGTPCLNPASCRIHSAYKNTNK